MQNIPKAVCPEEDVDRLEAILIDLARKSGGLRDPLANGCHALDLTPPQIHAVIWLSADGMLTMGELARRCGITEKTITGIVDRLERSGLIQRVRNETDRRVVQARLTPEGEKVVSAHRAHMRGQMAYYLGLFEPEERAALFRLFDKLLIRLGEVATLSRKESP